MRQHSILAFPRTRSLTFEAQYRDEQCLDIDSIPSAVRRPPNTITTTFTSVQWLFEDDELRKANDFNDKMETSAQSE